MTSHHRAMTRLGAVAVALLGLVTGLVATAPVAGAVASPESRVLLARERGFDVSYPQCGRVLPTRADFAIVGVDGGRPFDTNPCLAEQIVWARGFGRVQYYVNTANPGPRLSDHWPLGQRSPRVCSRSKPDSQGCAFDYGVNAAKDAFARARAAARAVGAPDVRRSVWWLDVETHNTWESVEYGERTKYLRNDTAVLAGMRHALLRRGVRGVGAYSTQHQWDRITGGASLGSAPVWYAGVGSRAQAARRCRPAYSFTGGPVRMTQFLAGSGLDGDLRC